MNIELRNIKYAAFASEETACFEATVYIDGKREGTVSNDGHGGCNRIHPRALEERLDAYAKTLPPVDVSHFHQDGERHTVACDTDIILGKLLDDALAARDLKRLLAGKIVFAKGGKILATNKLTPPTLALLLRDPAKTKERYKADAILNVLPFAEALTLYRGSAA